jgi:hypothetical protein
LTQEFQKSERTIKGNGNCTRSVFSRLSVRNGDKGTNPTLVKLILEQYCVTKHDWPNNQIIWPFTGRTALYLHAEHSVSVYVWFYVLSVRVDLNKEQIKLCGEMGAIFSKILSCTYKSLHWKVTLIFTVGVFFISYNSVCSISSHARLAQFFILWHW